MKFSKHWLILLPALFLCILIPSADAFEKSGRSVQEGESHRTAYFMINCPEYLSPDGILTTAGEAPLLDGDVGYIPVSSVWKVFGIDKSELEKHMIRLQGSDYLQVTELPNWSGLTLVRSGSIFALSDSGYIPEYGEFSVATEVFEYDALYEPKDTQRVFVPQYCVDPYVTYTYEQMLEDIEELVSAYPGLISAWQYGTTVEGRKMMAVSLGFGEREVLINASIHGSEYFSTAFVMNLIDKYAYGYAEDAHYEDWSYRELLDNTRFVISVMMNPDGVNICQNGLSGSDNYEKLRRMNMQQTGSWGWKANVNGVDLNRNFPFNWWNSNYVYEPGAKYYFGPEAASEPETRAMMALIESTPFYLFLDFHLYGENIDWIDSETMDRYDDYKTLAYTLMDAFGYYDRGAEKVDIFGGYLVNYVRNIYDTQALLIELCSIWKCPAILFDSQTRRVYPVLFYVGDTVAGMEDNGLGYRASYNGEDVLFTGERLRERALSCDQLDVILRKAGYTLMPENDILDKKGTGGVPKGFVKGIPVIVDPESQIALDLEQILFEYGISVRATESGGTLLLESFK